MTTTDDTMMHDTSREAASGPDTAETSTEQGDTPPESPNAEAARYRRRLREVETERDTLAARVETFQRREVERLAASHLSRPSDVWLDGAEIAGLLDDQGDVDPLAVQAATVAVLDGRPQLAPKRAADHGGGQRGVIPGVGTSWADVIKRG